MSGLANKESKLNPGQEPPTHLVLLGYPRQAQSEVAAMLERAGAAMAPLPAGQGKLPEPNGNRGVHLLAASEAEDAATQISRRLAKQPRLHCLCLVEGPVAHIALSLKDGHSLDEATRDWQDQTEAALALIRQHRFQCLTVLREQAEAEPARLIALLNEKFELALSIEHSPAAPDAEDALYSILAAQHVKQQEALSDLALELEASAYPLVSPEQSGYWDTTVAVEAYRSASRELEDYFRKLKQEEKAHKETRKELNNVRGERSAELQKQEEAESRSESSDENHQGFDNQLADLRQENEAMLAQLHKVQLELEDYFLRWKEAGKELDELKQTLARHDSEIDKKDQSIKTLEEQRAKLNQQLSQATQDIKRLDQKVEQFKNSTSWKITRPLRVLMRPFRRGRRQA